MAAFDGEDTLRRVVRLAGLEPTASAFAGLRSIQLSYKRTVNSVAMLSTDLINFITYRRCGLHARRYYVAESTLQGRQELFRYPQKLLWLTAVRLVTATRHLNESAMP